MYDIIINLVIVRLIKVYHLWYYIVNIVIVRLINETFIILYCSYNDRKTNQGTMYDVIVNVVIVRLIKVRTIYGIILLI